uniref:RGS domain-containing protein n=1 Tax=Ciona savignyi TaxID=51511 RepID=H2YYQ5_CIOSA
MTEQGAGDLNGASGIYRKLKPEKRPDTCKAKGSYFQGVKLRSEANLLKTSKLDKSHRSAPQLNHSVDKSLTGENSRSSPGRRQRPKSLFFRSPAMRRPRADTPSYTLADVLENKRMRLSFKLFLQSEFSSENFDFWCECERYRKVKRSAQKAKDAEKIYQEYICSMSPNQVNIDHVTRRQITEEMGCGDPPTSNIFDNAQRYIFTIMENDSFPRFVLSPDFKEITSKKHFFELRNILPGGRTTSPRSSAAKSSHVEANNAYILNLQNPTKYK